ncbi:MAG: cation:proton antiporter, partial [Pseudomonadota bacterium]|nr:cation:proton antiporter [Pseudomonadota bacterium]
MEYAFLLFAFICGLTVKLIGIPPLVGYLVAGFLLNFAGYTLTEDLTQIANLGITIMLFTIGLKLNIRDLSRREVWAGSVSHTLIWVGVITCCVYAIGAVAANFVDGLTWKSAALIAFALS